MRKLWDKLKAAIFFEDPDEVFFVRLSRLDGTVIGYVDGECNPGYDRVLFTKIAAYKIAAKARLSVKRDLEARGKFIRWSNKQPVRIAVVSYRDPNDSIDRLLIDKAMAYNGLKKHGGNNGKRA